MSKWFSYLVIGLVLGCFWFLIIPAFLELGIINGDLALNLVSEIWGLFFTLGMFIVVLEYRDWLERKPIKDIAKKRVEKQLYRLVIALTKVCKVSVGIGKFEGDTEDFVRELFFTQLEELNTKVELHPKKKKYLSNGYYTSLFQTRADNLSTLINKNYTFLDPALLKSLLIIEDNLESITTALNIKKNNPTWYTDEEFFEAISKSIQGIAKEIYGIHKKNEIKIHVQKA